MKEETQTPEEQEQALAEALRVEQERARISTAEQGTPSGTVPQDAGEVARNGAEPTPKRKAREGDEEHPWEQDDPAKPFKVTTWSGKPNYQCRECTFATTRGAARAIQHYYDKHAPALEKAARPLILGSNGQPLTR